MFCTHNECDLTIGLTRRKGEDYVVVRCRVCRRHLGTPFPLFDLVKNSVKRDKAAQDALDLEKQRREEEKER